MLTIVVGAQYGGEGKGKISAFLARNERFFAVCRSGGVNSAHDVIDPHGVKRKLRLLPTAAAVSDPAFVFYGAGTLLHVPTLFEEMHMLQMSRQKIKIDKNAGIVTEECIREQRKDPRYDVIGSTLTGTGYASAARCLRRLPVAKDIPELMDMIDDVPMILYNFLKRARHSRSKTKRILIEGHQGLGLSNYHGDYPFSSSRDCTVAEMLSELGLATNWPSRIILAVKAYPTRNHSGKLFEELSESDANLLGIKEFGGGSWGISDNRRRVGLFDAEDVVRAVRVNGATEIAITGADYLDPRTRNVTTSKKLTEKVWEFIKDVERVAQIPVTLVSTGPETDSMVRIDEKKKETNQPYFPNLLS